jgi:hypothetical protein
MPFTNGVAFSYVISTTLNLKCPWSIHSQFFCMTSNYCTNFFSSTTFKIVAALTLQLVVFPKLKIMILERTRWNFSMSWSHVNMYVFVNCCFDICISPLNLNLFHPYYVWYVFLLGLDGNVALTCRKFMML